MKNTYTILLMSSNQDSVRQLSIQRWFALCLGLVLCLVFFWIINFAVSGVKHGIRYRAELQGEVASREELENTIKRYEKEMQEIHKELQAVRKMSRQVAEWAGMNGQGVLGRGGGGFSTKEESENESASSIIETPPAPTSVSTNFADSALIDQIAQVRGEVTPVYEHLKGKVKEVREKPSILPIQGTNYWFSSGYGYRPDPLTEKLRFHNGLDIAAPRGTPVIATADGVIEEITKDPFFGNMVQIDHESTQMKTLYGHLLHYADDLQGRKEVKRYDVIGYVGNSGRSTGDHLHYGVYDNGKWQNPRNYFIDPSDLGMYDLLPPQPQQ